MSFSIFRELEFRAPALLFSFDLSILARIPAALGSLGDFSSVPPLELLEHSEAFNALGLVLAYTKPLVSGLAVLLAQLGVIKNPNKKLGEVAAADSSTAGILEIHAGEEDHGRLLKHLKVKGFDTSSMVLSEETRRLKEFVIKEEDREKVSGNVLQALVLYDEELRKIDISECKNVKGGFFFGDIFLFRPSNVHPPIMPLHMLNKTRRPLKTSRHASGHRHSHDHRHTRRARQGQREA